MNVVAPFGFYGAGNIGDEATLQGFAQLLRHHHAPLRTWVAAMDPDQTARAEPSFRYYRYQMGWRRYWTAWIRRIADAYVFPGGTPIMDSLGDWPLSEVVPMIRHARSLNKTVVFVGTGTETLRLPESRRLVADEIAQYVKHWSVRSASDRGRLTGLGVPPHRVTVAADVAWLIAPATPQFGKRLFERHGLGGSRVVGVNINAEHALLRREPEILGKLAMLLDRVIARENVRVAFLQNEIREGETYDLAAAKSVVALMQRRDAATIIPNDYLTPQQMMSAVACCELTISTRYHFCLFSALQNVPFLAIRRSDKVADLCDDLQWSSSVSPEEVDPHTHARLAGALLSGSDSKICGLSEHVGVMKGRALQNVAALDAMCPDVKPVAMRELSASR